MQHNAMQDRSVHSRRMLGRAARLVRHLMSGKDCGAAQRLPVWLCVSRMTYLLPKHVIKASLCLWNYSCRLSCKQRLYHIKASRDRLNDPPFESGVAGILQLSIDGAMVHQGYCCGVDELGQSAGHATCSMQPALLCTSQTDQIRPHVGPYAWWPLHKRQTGKAEHGRA